MCRFFGLHFWFFSGRSIEGLKKKLTTKEEPNCGRGIRGGMGSELRRGAPRRTQRRRRNRALRENPRKPLSSDSFRRLEHGTEPEAARFPENTWRPNGYSSRRGAIRARSPNFRRRRTTTLYWKGIGRGYDPCAELSPETHPRVAGAALEAF